jgi:putative pre-16S rRNA nuclease
MGLAVSDTLGITAQGLATLQRTRTKDDLDRLQKLVEEYDAEVVLVGHPLSQRGTETAMSERVAGFAAKLRRRVSCPVELADERLTSAQAERVLREAGLSQRKRRDARDRLSAVLLLQTFLDRRANERARAASRENS